MRPFLTAEWRHLLMLNFEVPRQVLAPFVSAGTELDLWEGRALVSVVGFRFLRTTLCGMPIPFHRNFDEVNLRFYVKRVTPAGEMRRGVTFIREIVPRAAIARVARLGYNEPYDHLPMRSTVPIGRQSHPPLLTYAWKSSGEWAHVSAIVMGEAALPEAETEASFITEHYWGYTRQRDEGTVEYEVSHPQWLVRNADSAVLSAPAARFYGPPFERYLALAPHSAFIAAGSPIAVHLPRRITSA